MVFQVFLAQRIRVELEALYMQTLRSGKKAQPPGTMQMTTSSMITMNTAGYKIEKSNNPIGLLYNITIQGISIVYSSCVRQ